MNYISEPAITIAIVMLIIIWAFLVHMMMSQRPDAHLEFLLDLMGASEESSKNSSPAQVR